MAEIQTEHGTVLVDDEDAALLAGKRVSVYLSGKGRRPTTYPMVLVNGKSLARRLMQPPEGMEVDHINRDPLDNRRSNLRLATRLEQVANRRGWGKNPHSYRGLYLDKATGTWRARISMRREPSDRQYAHPFRYVAVGRSKNIHEAALMWNKAAKARWGEATNCNDVPCFSGSTVPREDRCPTCHAVCFCCCVCG